MLLIGLHIEIMQTDERLLQKHAMMLQLPRQLTTPTLKKLSCLMPHEFHGMPKNEREQLIALLGKYHQVFSLMEGERGETDLATMSIDTGDTILKKKPVRRVPFAVRWEVAQQLKQMQNQGVIQPSSSPWASLVRKKDGSLRICVDYRHLNNVTKPDTFPLPGLMTSLTSWGVKSSSRRWISLLVISRSVW